MHPAFKIFTIIAVELLVYMGPKTLKITSELYDLTCLAASINSIIPLSFRSLPTNKNVKGCISF